jgi:hypothetical protein
MAQLTVPLLIEVTQKTSLLGQISQTPERKLALWLFIGTVTILAVALVWRR